MWALYKALYAFADMLDLQGISNVHACPHTHLHTYVHTHKHTHFCTDAVKLPQATSLAMLLKVSTAQPPSQDLMSYSHWVEPAHSMSVS